MTERYIGLMSGTSMDGIDGALCGFAADGAFTGVDAYIHHDFDPALRQALASLQSPGANELHRAALAANALVRAAHGVCTALLAQAGLKPADVKAVGMHGQTVRHQPGLHDGVGYTLQLNQPALLAELCSIDVIADFRSRDVAAGGQGAPLVPPFHQAAFGNAQQPQAVANIGGISNLTVLAPGEPLRGFDCGPGNALLDEWCQRQLGLPFDDDGQWAAGGQCVPALLQRLLAEPYLAEQPPKSTGRDLFNAAWLDARLDGFSTTPPRDVQATLAVFTAAAITQDVNRYASSTGALLVCGGGALNGDLMRRLRQQLPGVSVESTASRGLPPLQVEAAAFAWLARMHCHGLPAGRADVTGARGDRILGARYPAG